MTLRATCLAVIALLTVGTWFTVQGQDENLSVLDGWMAFSDAPNALYHQLHADAGRLLDARAQAVAALRTPEDWRRRQATVRAALAAAVGPFPEKTLLQARVTGMVHKDGFRMEKVVFESQPDFFVTAALYVPDAAAGPAPAVVYCSGHTENGFRSPTYQRVILNLVRKGFVVLAIDPVGQGERLQYVDPETGTSRVGGATKENAYPGAQAFIVGLSLARTMIWDGIRAVDYLLTRPEVDPQRIGITGRSGGGTQAAYIAAFDDRIRAAAPENYLTGFRRLMASIGPQDAEQNFLHGLALGLDHADLLVARAPEPALLIATTRDFFNIQGARDTFREAHRAYEAFGAGDQLRMAEDDAGHASTRRNREALYRFFQQALDRPGNATDEDVPVLTDEELRITSTGQVMTSLGGATVHTLIRTHAEALAARLDSVRRSAGHREAVVAAARRLSGFVDPGLPSEPVLTGRYPREGYVVEQYFLPGEGAKVVPYLLMVPDAPGPHPAVLYLHPGGKALDAAPGGALETLVQQGYTVLSPDLPGLGELGPGAFRGDAYDFNVGTGAYNLWFAGVLTGRSLVGLRAEDVVRLTAALRARPDVDDERLSAVAQGTLGPVLLHAAAFDSTLRAVALIESLASYKSVVEHEYYAPDLMHAIVPAALTGYDLPDLAAVLAPRPLLLAGPTDKMKRPLDPATVERAYGAAGATSHIELQPAPENGWINPVLSWLEALFR